MIIGRRLSNKAHLLEDSSSGQYRSLCGKDVAHKGGFKLERQTCGAEFTLCRLCLKLHKTLYKMGIYE